MDELHWISAGEALEAFRKRSLSPVEYMAAVIARTETVEPDINAFGHTFFADAMARAREAEARYAARSGNPRALEGIAVAVKEETPVRGQRTTQGSLIYKDWIPDYTTVCIQRIIDAGGIVHARSTAPEFSCPPFTPFPSVGYYSESVESQVQSRRFVGRRWGGPGGGINDARNWLGHSGFDSNSGGVLRRGRVQASLRPGA